MSVYLGSHGSYHKYIDEEGQDCIIAAISVSGKTKWDMLDAMVRRAFKVSKYIHYIYHFNNISYVTYINKNTVELSTIFIQPCQLKFCQLRYSYRQLKMD